MAFRRNPGYRTDPAIREGFNNLAAMFAPPSGAELAGFATANAKRAEAERIADLFARAGNANLTPEQMTALDQQMAVQAGGWQNSRWRFSQDDRRARDINAADNQRMLATNAADNQRAVAVEAMRPIARDAVAPAMPSIANQFGIPELAQPRRGIVEVAPGQRAVLPDNSVIEGAPKPMSLDETRAAAVERQRAAGQLTDQQIADVVLDKTIEAMDPATGRRVIVAPGRAVREGMSPVENQSPDRVDNYLAVGPDGKEVRFLGRIGPNGQIVDANTGQPVPNVVRREGTQGGMSVEVGKDGTFRLVTGNNAGQTNARTTDLQRQSAEAGRAVNELTALFNNLRPDDLGVAGNVNDILTNYGGQIAPGLARPDVTGTRNQMRATTLSLAKALVGDERLSDADRRAAEEVSVSNGIDESLPGARAKIASLIVINAYRQRYADTVRQGQKLPPLSPQIVGQLVDEKVIEPAIAQEYVRNNFARGAQQGGIIPGVNTPQMPGAASAPTQQRPDPQAALNEARAAIQRGAPREAVMQRLQSMGIDPGGL